MLCLMSTVNSQQSTDSCRTVTFIFLINILCLKSTVNSQQSADSCRTVIFNFQFSIFNSQHSQLFSSIIIFSARSKNTILAFTFCSICRCASLSSSMMPNMFFSFTKGAKREVKLVSSAFM